MLGVALELVHAIRLDELEVFLTIEVSRLLKIDRERNQAHAVRIPQTQYRRKRAVDLKAGADEKIVQRVLRHAKAHVTKDRYIKAFDPAVLAAMKRMETTLDAMKLCAPTVHQIN